MNHDIIYGSSSEEVYLIFICKSLNAFRNLRECDIPDECQSNLKIGDADGDSEDTPGHSLSNVVL